MSNTSERVNFIVQSAFGIPDIPEKEKKMLLEPFS